MSEKSYKVSPLGQVESGSEGFARSIARKYRSLAGIGWIQPYQRTMVESFPGFRRAAERDRSRAALSEWCRHWTQWYEDTAEFDWEAEFVNAR